MQLSLYIVNSKNPASLKALQNVKYFVFQREKGNDTGTEHFQLYVEFDMGKKFEVMKKNFPTAHIESRKESKTQAMIIAAKTIREWADIKSTSTANLPKTENAPTSAT